MLEQSNTFGPPGEATPNVICCAVAAIERFVDS